MQSLQHIYDENLDMNEKKVDFILHSQGKHPMTTQRSFLNFNSYFSAEAVSIGTVSGQGSSPRKSTVIFEPETNKLPMKSLSRVFSLKQGESTDGQRQNQRESFTISIVSKLDLSPV